MPRRSRSRVKSKRKSKRYRSPLKALRRLSRHHVSPVQTDDISRFDAAKDLSKRIDIVTNRRFVDKLEFQKFDLFMRGIIETLKSTPSAIDGSKLLYLFDKIKNDTKKKDLFLRKMNEKNMFDDSTSATEILSRHLGDTEEHREPVCKLLTILSSSTPPSPCLNDEQKKIDSDRKHLAELKQSKHKDDNELRKIIKEREASVAVAMEKMAAAWEAKEKEAAKAAEEAAEADKEAAAEAVAATVPNTALQRARAAASADKDSIDGRKFRRSS